MALRKLDVKYTQNSWGMDNISPKISDWSGNVIYSVMNAVSGDSILFALWLKETDMDGNTSDADLSDVKSLHCIIRSEKSPYQTSKIIGYQTEYNQGNLPEFENLASGGVVWKLGVGPIRYPIVGVDTTNNQFYIDENFSFQFSEGDAITVKNSTGNDGIYTVDTGVAYNGTENRTEIPVKESVGDGTADGILVHNTLSSLISGNNYIDAYVECTSLSSDDDPQTLLPAVPVRVHQQLDNYATGISPNNAPDYVTSSELDSQGFMELFSPITVSSDTTLSAVKGIRWVFVNTDGGDVTITLPPASANEYCMFYIVNIGSNAVYVASDGTDTINGESTTPGTGTKWGCFNLRTNGVSNWHAPNLVIP